MISALGGIGAAGVSYFALGGPIVWAVVGGLVVAAILYGGASVLNDAENQGQDAIKLVPVQMCGHIDPVSGSRVQFSHGGAPVDSGDVYDACRCKKRSGLSICSSTQIEAVACQSSPYSFDPVGMPRPDTDCTDNLVASGFDVTMSERAACAAVDCPPWGGISAGASLGSDGACSCATASNGGGPPLDPICNLILPGCGDDL